MAFLSIRDSASTSDSVSSTEMTSESLCESAPQVNDDEYSHTDSGPELGYDKFHGSLTIMTILFPKYISVLNIEYRTKLLILFVWANCCNIVEKCFNLPLVIINPPASIQQ